MRVFVAILLMLSLGCQSLVKLGIVAWYHANKEYIAKNLCENRDKPELKCCGKCYLRKQLAKADGKTDTPARRDSRSREKVDWLDCILPDVFQISVSHTFLGARLYPAAVVATISGHYPDIFHPPALLPA